MDLKNALEKINKAENEKTRLEEQIKMLEQQENDLKEELAEMGIDDIKDIDKEIKTLQDELETAIKQIEGIENGETVDDDDTISLESLGL